MQNTSKAIQARTPSVIRLRLNNSILHEEKHRIGKNRSISMGDENYLSELYLHQRHLINAFPISHKSKSNSLSPKHNISSNVSHRQSISCLKCGKSSCLCREQKFHKESRIKNLTLTTNHFLTDIVMDVKRRRIPYHRVSPIVFSKKKLNNYNSYKYNDRLPDIYRNDVSPKMIRKKSWNSEPLNKGLVKNEEDLRLLIKFKKNLLEIGIKFMEFYKYNSVVTDLVDTLFILVTKQLAYKRFPYIKSYRDKWNHIIEYLTSCYTQYYYILIHIIEDVYDENKKQRGYTKFREFLHKLNRRLMM